MAVVLPPEAEGAQPHDKIDIAAVAKLVSAQKTFAKNLTAAALPRSKPLLKFDADGNEGPYLHPDGLELLRSVKRAFPVAFIGDGRSGKSFLASYILGTEAFFSDDACSAVTTGIDVAIAPLDKVARQVARLCPDGVSDELQEALASGSLKDEHAVIFDCEGGNNAMAQVRRLVDVFALAACTQIVFVSHSMATEASLQNIATAMASLELIKFSPDVGVQTARHLTYIVNQTTLKYASDHFEKILAGGSGGEGSAARSELREALADTFVQRQFFPVPYNTLPDFKELLGNFVLSLFLNRQPLLVDGMTVSGGQMASMLQLIVEELSKMGEVSGPSVARVVLVDGFLQPLSCRLLAETKDGFGSLADFDASLADRDPRQKTLEDFRSASQCVTQRSLVAEVEEQLSASLDEWWAGLCRQNDALGEHVLRTASEKRVVVEDTGNERLGGTSLLGKICVSVEICHDEERQVVYLKNGQTMPSTEWTHGPRYTRWREGDVHALRESLSNLPQMKGQISQPTTGLFGFTRLSPCFCVVQDLHLLWWDDEAIFTRAGASESCQVAGAANLLKYSDIKVEKDGDTGFAVTLTTAAAAAAGSGGAAAREVVRRFDVRHEQSYAGLSCCTSSRPKGARGQGTPKLRDEWVSCLQQQISMAKTYRTVLGDAKVPQPTLTDMLGESRSIFSLETAPSMGTASQR